ncbi:MAG TPA: hypothetical protein ENH41_05580 [Candidatus Omnitrophica bacterium]|nr:hypothetical protein [Candidatus Omnitrophota bacterium]
MKRLKLVLIIGAILAAGVALFIFTRPKPYVPKVVIKMLEDGRYQLFVREKPYFIKGVCYNPTPIGEGYDYDLGKDKFEPWLVDAKLMQEAGINTIRLYKDSEDPEGLKKAIRHLYENYGIRTILGHWLGFWNYPQPAYADPEFRERIKKEVLDMVNTYKDEEGMLFWVLGNENNYSFSGRVNSWYCQEAEGKDPTTAINIKAKIYYSFVNEIASAIHEIDPDHPVGLGNGELACLDMASEVSPEIDFVAVLMYRGRSFGNTFNFLKKIFNKPLVFVEFGADAYNSYKKEEDEEMQAFFLESQWKDLYKHSGFSLDGAGNCLGGTMFEWSDEWWKHNSDIPAGWREHDVDAGWSSGSYYLDIKAEKNLNMNEEWFGIVGISEEKEAGINKRTPRAAYYKLKEFWQSKKDF